MVRLDRIYTGGGDKGETSLGSGLRVPKDSARVDAMGDVDEANSVIGLARRHVFRTTCSISARTSQHPAQTRRMARSVSSRNRSRGWSRRLTS